LGSISRLLRYPSNALFILRVWITYHVWGIVGQLFGESRYEAGQRWLHRSFATSFFNRAIKHKGLLIKIGQVVSSRADVMPPEYIEILSKLQDRIPPVDYEKVRLRIELELNRPIDSVFARFDKTPIASASIGQVHEAWLADGSHVAVKVQYPEIDAVVESDLRALRLAFFLFSLRARIKVGLLYEEMRKVLLGELNYVREGKFAERFRSLFEADKRVVAPRIYWEYTTTKVLTMEFVQGQKIPEFAASEKNEARRKRIIERLVDVYAAQIFQHGFFHADPHPGNIFISDQDEIVFVDFGICSELQDDTREALRFMARSIISFNVEEMVEGAKKLGVISLDEDEQRTRELLLFAVREFRDIAPKEFKDKLRYGEWLKKLHAYFHEVRSFQVPHRILLFLRTVSILEGHLAALDPQLNLIHIAKPYIKRYVMEEKRPMDFFAEELRRFALTLFRLPGHAERFLEKTNRGVTFIRTSDGSTERLVALLPAFFFAAVTCLMLFMTPVMFLLDKIPYAQAAGLSFVVFFVLTLRAYYKAVRK